MRLTEGLDGRRLLVAVASDSLRTGVLFRVNPSPCLCVVLQSIAINRTEKLKETCERFDAPGPSLHDLSTQHVGKMGKGRHGSYNLRSGRTLGNGIFNSRPDSMRTGILLEAAVEAHTHAKIDPCLGDLHVRLHAPCYPMTACS